MEDDRFLDTPLGAYDLTVRQVGTVGQETIQSQSDLVDQRNLYESCSVDQQKQTIDGGCETGILLFCRNEFHPFMNTSLAKKDTFSNICECVDVLCAGLPSGENIGSGFDKLLQMTYALFAVLSIGAILVFTIVMVDLFREGDFHDCKACAPSLCFAVMNYIRDEARLSHLVLEHSLLCVWPGVLLNTAPID